MGEVPESEKMPTETVNLHLDKIQKTSEAHCCFGDFNYIPSAFQRGLVFRFSQHML